jgi:hypothetical protein
MHSKIFPLPNFGSIPLFIQASLVLVSDIHYVIWFLSVGRRKKSVAKGTKNVAIMRNLNFGVSLCFGASVDRFFYFSDFMEKRLRSLD